VHAQKYSRAEIVADNHVAPHSKECDIFHLVLWHCWLGDRKGIRSVAKKLFVCWWWWFDWSFTRLIYL